MAKFVVTGGCGFIGSRLVARLVREGHNVVVIDNLSSGFMSYLPSSPLVTLVYRDIGKKLFNIKELDGADGIFHFAAQARIQPTIKKPALSHKTNITGIFNILEVMRTKNIKNIVFSSSSSIYGLKNVCPLVESMESDCLNPYSLSKYVGEKYIQTYCKLFGINGISLRYFNVWGPREVLFGQYAPVVGIFFRQLLEEHTPMTIVGDGSQRRDFTHVDDVVDANMKSMELLGRERKFGDVINIGSGRNYSVLQLAHLVRNAVGLGEEFISFVPPRPAEMQATLANIEKAKELLGWSPQVSLPDKIEEHCAYYRYKFEK